MKSAVLLAALLATPVTVSMQGCTDLTEVPFSAISPENYYRNEAEVLGGLAAVYATMRQTLEQYYNITEVSSDEIIVPTRGQNWKDNGKWLDLDRQTWGANSPIGLDDMNGMYVNLFQGVARANILLSALDNVTVPKQDTIVAEVRTLRAFYYFLLQDMFGGIPIVTGTEIAARPKNTRAEVFAFIESELIEAREDLPPSWPAAANGRMTKGAADAILASLYLNAQVFSGTVTTAGLTPGTARWADAVTVADRILNSGEYTLAPEGSWKSNFAPDNQNSTENILVAKFLAADGLGLTMPQRALHYNQFGSPSPWNGFSTISEVYAAFDADDERREIFLTGQGYSIETGLPVNTTGGEPLVFTADIADVTQATESEGYRWYKWPLDPNRSQQFNGNDYAHFRLAEIMLIKAEALNELGQKDAAVAIVNTLRARVFEPDEPLNPAAFTQATFRDQILAERLFELAGEAKRRQDLIRHGKFTSMTWFNKGVTDPFRILMPFPQGQLDVNPLLEQNPGY